MITRNNSCVRLAISSFHELQKLQIFATGARRGQSGRSASRSYYVLVLRICLRAVDARMPSPRFPLFMIYSSRVQHIFIVYSAYIRHIFITYPFDIHLFYISRCITPTPSLSLYLYPSYINPHTLSLSKSPVVQGICGAVLGLFHSGVMLLDEVLTTTWVKVGDLPTKWLFRAIFVVAEIMNMDKASILGYNSTSLF